MKSTNCCNLYDNQFDDKVAQRDLKNHLKGKDKKETKKLLHMLSDVDVSNKSLLDIGGGVGVIADQLFKKGLEKSTMVDISRAYQSAAKSLLSGYVSEGRSHFILGDFSQVYTNIETADIVTLDKVICCYEDFDSLVKTSVARANSIYAIILPRNAWWVKLFNKFGVVWRKISGNEFNSYIHPIKEIEKIIHSAGFRQFKFHAHWEWLIRVYRKD